MSHAQVSTLTAPLHGARELTGVIVESYNVELREPDRGFLGDRANDGAFAEIIDHVRRRSAGRGDDPLQGRDSKELRTEDLENLLDNDRPSVAALVDEAIDEFALEMLHIVGRFRAAAAGWRAVERVVVGGGLGASRIGRRIVERLGTLAQPDDVPPIEQLRYAGDEAGLIGGAHLLPREALAEADALLAVDIGGSKVRVGLIAPHFHRARDLSRIEICESQVWRHAEERSSRDEIMARLAMMLGELARRATVRGMSLAPMLAVACPGAIDDHGFITRGAQNLPGHWEGDGFNLPRALEALFGTGFSVILHNDAVVQGLSQRPFMADVQRWAILTIGTGLGNACFTNR